MPIIDRKRRQFLARQQMILEETETLYGDKGYLGLNLDELADRISYSKATLYNHYGSKEELLCAVAVKLLEERAFFLSHALVFEGTSRERMLFVGMADAFLISFHPHCFEIIQLVTLPSFWERSSPGMQDRFRMTLENGQSTLHEIIRLARRTGDIEMSERRLPANEIITGLTALVTGLSFTSLGRADEETAAPIIPSESFLLHYEAYLDGLGWHELSLEKDYAPFKRQALATLKEAADLI